MEDVFLHVSLKTLMALLPKPLYIRGVNACVLENGRLTSDGQFMTPPDFSAMNSRRYKICWG
jgi:hypothetical protein